MLRARTTSSGEYDSRKAEVFPGHLSSADRLSNFLDGTDFASGVGRYWRRRCLRVTVFRHRAAQQMSIEP